MTENWTVDDVTKWLKDLAIGDDIIDKFKAEEVDGSTLLSMTADDLKDMDLKMAPRKKILDGIEKLGGGKATGKKMSVKEKMALKKQQREQKQKEQQEKLAQKKEEKEAIKEQKKEEKEALKQEKLEQQQQQAEQQQEEGEEPRKIQVDTEEPTKVSGLRGPKKLKPKTPVVKQTPVVKKKPVVVAKGKTTTTTTTTATTSTASSDDVYYTDDWVKKEVQYLSAMDRYDELRSLVIDLRVVNYKLKKNRADIKVLAEVEFKTAQEYFKWLEDQKVLMQENKKYIEMHKDVVTRFSSTISYESRIKELSQKK